MGWLAVTDEQKAEADALNAESEFVKVCVVRGINGWITDEGPVASAVPNGYFAHFASWYASLQPTDDTPAPRVRPTPRPRPQ